MGGGGGGALRRALESLFRSHVTLIVDVESVSTRFSSFCFLTLLNRSRAKNLGEYVYNGLSPVGRKSSV